MVELNTGTPLTKEQGEKIIEMVTYLFPDWEFDLFASFNKNARASNHKIRYALKSADKYTHWNHWFEFCLTVLYPALSSKCDINIDHIIYGERHIVEVLHYHFIRDIK